ncbi:hypothetical protein LUQ84_003195 [Hamiltosporidium tvaerminnensis]|nr:hypothetical protein LUQ84_003195 [Hamiltosporidium tvaerminnensis]
MPYNFKKETMQLIKILNFLKTCTYFVLKYSIMYLNIYLEDLQSISINCCAYSINVEFLSVNETNKADLYSNQVENYFLNKENLEYSENITPRKRIEMKTPKLFTFLYPDDTFLKLGFFEKLINENKTKIQLLVYEKEYFNILYFFTIARNRDEIMMIDLEMFFHILKYLNIMDVDINKNYHEFIKSLVFYVKNFNEEYTRKFGLEKLLDYKRYNSYHILDITKCFLKFNLFSKYNSYLTFHEYNKILFSQSRIISENLKQYKKFITMQITDFNYIAYIRSVSSIFNSTWKILCRVLYFDKLYIGLSFIHGQDIDTNMLVCNLPKNIRKIDILASNNISLVDKLYEFGVFTTIKNVKIIQNASLYSFLKRMNYFDQTQMLKFELNRMSFMEINALEKINLPQSIKILKIIICKFSEFRNRTPNHYLLGNIQNLVIDSSSSIEISDDETNFAKLSNDGYYKYLIGADFFFYESKFNLHDYKDIFKIEKIIRLNLTLLSAKDNFLEDYSFLRAFKSLKNLYLENFKLTNELLREIVNCKKLVSLYFMTFEYDESIDAMNLNVCNNSIIYIKIKCPKNVLDCRFIYLLSRFTFLQHLIFRDVSFSNKEPENFNQTKNPIELNLLLSGSAREQLKTLKIKNNPTFANRNTFSILNIYSKYFNLQYLHHLTYEVCSFYQEDIYVFSSFKQLHRLELNVKRRDSISNILKQILRTNIKHTINRMLVQLDKFIDREFLEILYFKKIKILILRIESISETDKKYLNILYNMNFNRLEVYIFKNENVENSISKTRKLIYKNYN